MAFSIEKYSNDENPEFADIPQVKTENIIGKPHVLDYVEFGKKKDGTDYVRVRGDFSTNMDVMGGIDANIMWYYTASYGLVGTLKRVMDDVGYIPKVCVKIEKVDTGKQNSMLIYRDA